MPRIDRRMRIVTDQHGDRRRAEQPVRLDIPADAPQHLAPRGSKAQTKLATVAPVTKPTEALAGSPSRSSSHPAATASIADAAGAAWRLAAFCPQAAASQSAATPVGCELPITQPKKRGPVEARMPGAARGRQFRR